MYGHTQQKKNVDGRFIMAKRF